jgi:DNA-binding transcriptional ArsR family regulator
VSRLTDPRALRAYAHPVRMALVGLLRTEGPLTATRAAELLGESSGTCSFHLRQLAKYGFVEDAGPGGDRRERQWRTTQPRLSIRSGTGGDAAAQQQIERLVVERELRAILDYSQRPDGASPEWRHKAGIVTMMAVLSPDEVADLKEKWIALITPYTATARADDPRAGQRHVRYFMAATPLPEPEPGDGA